MNPFGHYSFRKSALNYNLSGSCWPSLILPRLPHPVSWGQTNWEGSDAQSKSAMVKCVFPFLNLCLRTWWINHELSDRFWKNIYPAKKKQTSSSQISMFSLILSRTLTGSLWSCWLPVSSLSVSSHHDSLHRGLSISGKTNWITQMRPDMACIRFWCVGVSEMFGLRVMCECDPCLGLLWPEVFCFDVCSSTALFNLHWFICLQPVLSCYLPSILC